MSSPRRRKSVVTVIAASAAALVLAGCSNGFDAGTVVAGDAAAGSTLKTETAEVHNVLVLAEENAEPRIIGSIVNESGTDDALVGVTFGESDTPVALTGVEGESIPVPTGSLVKIADAEGPQLNLGEVDLSLGTWETVTFQFETGGEATGDVLVVPSVTV